MEQKFDSKPRRNIYDLVKCQLISSRENLFSIKHKYSDKTGTNVKDACLVKHTLGDVILELVIFTIFYTRLPKDNISILVLEIYNANPL
jgi:hypothetical protein